MSTLEYRIESCFECLTIPRKPVQNLSKKLLQNKDNNKKRFLGKTTAPVTMILQDKCGWSKAKDWW